ncbi:MAG: XRE family transcriptional regulator [Pseudomonadota bacterium]
MGKVLEYEHLDQALADRLTSLRQNSGRTLDDVATLSGISRATLSRIERAETSPTAQVLGRLCAVYNVTMSHLLLALEEEAPRLIRQADAAVWRDHSTGFVRTAISPPAHGYDIELVGSELPSGAVIEYETPPSCGMEQHIVVLEGTLLLTHGDSDYELGPRDCLRMKLQSTTRFQNPGPDSVRYIVAIRTPK